MLAEYAAAHPELDDDLLRGVAVMTDERYVVRTERLADAHAAHGPVWRSRYDGPYTAVPGEAPDPEFARAAPLLHGAHGSDGAGIWHGGDGLAAALHGAWGAFATAGDPGWPRYEPGERTATVFAEDGPRLEKDPFAPAREAWSGLHWQPGTWWQVDDAP
jgi:para-nitrobenzyl esterase